MEQIRDRGYEQYLENDGRHNLLLYGIAFYKPWCCARRNINNISALVEWVQDSAEISSQKPRVTV